MNSILSDPSFIAIIVHSGCSTDAFISPEKEKIDTTNGFFKRQKNICMNIQIINVDNKPNITFLANLCHTQCRMPYKNLHYCLILKRAPTVVTFVKRCTKSQHQDWNWYGEVLPKNKAFV